jgi:hypothetical protein
MLKSILTVLVVVSFALAQAPQQQGSTIEQAKAQYQQLKDANVSVAAQNNQAYTVLLQLIDQNQQLQKQVADLQKEVATNKGVKK